MEDFESFEEGKRRTKNSRQAIPESVTNIDTTSPKEESKFDQEFSKAIRESFIARASNDNNQGSSTEGSNSNDPNATKEYR